MSARSTPTTRTYITPKPTTEPDQPKPPRRKIKLLNRKQLPWLLIVLLILACGLLFFQYRQAQNKLDGGKAENAKIERQLKAMILLKTEKSPTIATVNDARKLRSQAFFKDTENGDKVLVYSDLRKAILYRPTTNMIINVQPVNLSEDVDPAN